MKYGETLRQRSIPAWSHHNIDYDDIKYLIKERTTPGQSKTVPVPGHGDEKLHEFEATLFQILVDQHERIDLFVKSKAGEIRRRLDHAKRQLKQLSASKLAPVDDRIPIARLERYGRLENDVLKAGDEIRSLARFVGTQRTAIRKLLKKYRKWTGSTDLETRLREDVLDDPKSFTNLDLGPLLDEYSETLHQIRSVYETGLQQRASSRQLRAAAESGKVSSGNQLRAALRNGSRVEFDTAIATIPLGEGGSIANYFVHPENVVELQVLLLQYMEYFWARSRANSTTTPVSPVDQPGSNDTSPDPDYFTLVADDLDRLAHEQSATTVNTREHVPGVCPQMAKAIVRWNNDEDAVVSARLGAKRTKSAALKRKHIDSFFDRDTASRRNSESNLAKDNEKVSKLRDEILAESKIQSLYKLATCRSRFTGVDNGSTNFTAATLDNAIAMQKAGDAAISRFPFAVLYVRKEGAGRTDIISTLDESHLVERVRGFSLQYHALWETWKPENISTPFWVPILSHDIRKLPPPAIKRTGSAAGGGSGSQSATHRSTSTNSIRGATESTTVAESSLRESSVQLETPPLRSFRKKRRRTYAENSMERQRRYWSEYDHPEHDEGGEDAYVLYIDPNEKSTLDRLFDKLGDFFTRRQPEEESLIPSPATPNDDEESSDEEEMLPSASRYGTLLQQPHGPRQSSAHRRHHRFLPQITTMCLIASVVILIVAYILVTTSKHKYATEVDAGVVFAIACSLAFAVIGFIPLLGRRNVHLAAWGVATAVLLVDAVASGFLLAWVVG